MWPERSHDLGCIASGRIECTYVLGEEDLELVHVYRYAEPQSLYIGLHNTGQV